jgi:hypothetical protein
MSSLSESRQDKDFYPEVRRAQRFVIECEWVYKTINPERLSSD